MLCLARSHIYLRIDGSVLVCSRKAIANIVLQALEGKEVKDLLSNVGSGGAAAAPAAGGAAGGAAAAAEETKEEAKEEEKEESDDDMGFGLFD